MRKVSENWKKRLAALALSLVLLTLTGCQWGTAGADSSSPSSALETAGQVSDSDREPSSVSSTSQVPLVTVEGEVAQASKSAFELQLEDGASFTVVLTDETSLTGGPLVDGSRASVTWAGEAQPGDTVTALEVELTSRPSPSPSPIPSPSVAPALTEEPGESLARQILSTMTLEEKVGQLFFVRVPKGDAAALAAQYQFGGYLLFGRDFQGLTKEQVQENIASYQSAVKIPMLMGVDEEGDTVVRVSSNPALCDEPYWSPRALYDAGGLDLVLSVEQDKIQTLQRLGIQVNFAPVCDISQDPSGFMYDRSLGRDPQETASYVKAVAQLYRENSMGCVLKHFPGYGENGDTHTGGVVDQRPYETFQQRDFLPFEAGIQGGAGCVLVCHNIVTCKDGSYPASLSPEWHRILREELGFEGCIITDDLIMDAVQEYCDATSAAVQAVLAGNDLLCCSDYETQYPAVLAAVKSGQISLQRLEESVLRVLSWKEEMGLLSSHE